MTKVTITRISRSTTNKEGLPLVGKNGKPYTRLGIQTVEHADKWLSGFGSYMNEKWVEGMSVEIEVTQNGEYLNFSTPSKTDLLEKRVEVLEAQMGIAKPIPAVAPAPVQPVVVQPVAQAQPVAQPQTAPVQPVYPEAIDPSEIPF